MNTRHFRFQKTILAAAAALACATANAEVNTIEYTPTPGVDFTLLGTGNKNVVNLHGPFSGSTFLVEAGSNASIFGGFDLTNGSSFRVYGTSDITSPTTVSADSSIVVTGNLVIEESPAEKAGPLVNNGTILVNSGATLDIKSDFTNNATGSVSVSGSLIAKKTDLSGAVVVNSYGRFEASGETRLRGSATFLVDSNASAQFNADLFLENSTLENKGTLAVAGTLSVANGGLVSSSALDVGELDASLSPAIVEIIGHAGIGLLRAGADSEITIGSPSVSSSKLLIKDSDPEVGGGLIRVIGANAIGEVEKATQLYFEAEKLSSIVLATPNTEIVLGKKNGNIATLGLLHAGLVWNRDITGIVSLEHPTTLVSGSIVAAEDIATAPTAANRFALSPKTALVVNAAKLEDRPALKADGNGGVATVATGAPLIVANAQAGQTYTILEGFNGAGSDLVDDKGFTRVYSTDQLVNLAQSIQTGTGTLLIRAEGKNEAEIEKTLPHVVPIGMLNEVYSKGLNDVDSANPGVRFISRAVNTGYIAPKQAAQAINSATLLSTITGVYATSVFLADAVHESIIEETSWSRAGGRLRTKRTATWARAVYSDLQLKDSSLKDQKVGYDIDHTGIAFGLDREMRVMSGINSRVGLALSVGKGKAKTTGEMLEAENDFDSKAASVYLTLEGARAGLILDGGVVLGSNAISAPTAIGKARTEFDSLTLHAGANLYYRQHQKKRLVNGEPPRFTSSWTPHIGAHFYRVMPKAHTTELDGEKAFNTEKETLDLLQAKAGLTGELTYRTEGGARIGVVGDITAHMNLKDRESTARVGLVGSAASDTVTMKATDKFFGRASLGMQAVYGGHTLSLSAHYHKGDESTAKGGMIHYRYRF